MQPVPKKRRTKGNRNHFVSRFCLERFVDSEDSSRIWLYDKEGDGDEPLSSSPSNTAVQEHFYSVILSDGTRDTKLDDLFHHFETDSAPSITKILSRQALSFEERDLLSQFIGLSMVRVPAYMDAYVRMSAASEKENIRLVARDPAFVSRMMARLTEQGDPPARESLVRAQRMLAEGRFELDDKSRGVAVEAILGFSTYGAIFREMSWTILTVRNGRYRFVTCDNPVWFESLTTSTHPADNALLAPPIEVSFPLSRDSALVAGWGGPPIEYLLASENVVRTVNHRTIAAAQRWVYAAERSEGLLTLVRRYRGSGRQMVVSSFPTISSAPSRGRQTLGFVGVMNVVSGPPTPRRSVRPGGRICKPDRRGIAMENVEGVRDFIAQERARARAARTNPSD
jgi:hypothetical protein